MKLFIITCLLVHSVLLQAAQVSRSVSNADLKIIKENIYNEILKSVPIEAQSKWLVPEINGWLKNQNSDGSFKDLNYTVTDKTLWGPASHIQRIRQIFLATKFASHPRYKSKVAISAANKGLNFFSSRKWHHKNWWHREIGLPRNIYTLLILAGDQIAKDNYDVLMDYAYQGHLTDHPSGWPATGQNNVWFSETTVALGVLFERHEWVNLAIRSVEKEFSINQKAGIQSDQTFYQHGQVFHNGGYGLDFSKDLANFFSRINGTSYSFSDKSYDILSNFILDGQLWLIHKTVMDYSSKARHYPREGGGRSEYLLPSCVILSKVAGDRQDEFKECAKKLSSKNYTRHGNKMFYRGDFMTHHRSDYNISVKMHSTRTLNNDTSPLGEGLKSHHLSDGVTYIYRTGNEYWDIFPIWDFKMVPGTTEQYVFPYPKVPNDDYWPSPGNTAFVGGVSDGEFGAAVMDFKRDRLQAKKSWFFSDESMVAFGAELNCPNCRDVRTSLNQELSKTPIVYGSVDSLKEHVLENGIESFPTRSWAIANGTGYAIHSGGTLKLSNQKQTGTWRSIDANKSSNEVHGKVTSLWLSHEKNPRSKTYAYSVYPNTKYRNDLADKIKNTEALSNTGQIQAVFFKKEKMAQAIFYSPGELKFNNNKSSISTTQPVALMVRELPSGKLKITVSDPSQKLQSLSVGIRWDNSMKRNVSFVFPKRPHLGRSVSKEI